MKKLAVAIALVTLLPLAGCATPYGYSPGAWANYDGDYDAGYDGYSRPITYYGQVSYVQPYGNGYYAGQSYYGSGYYGSGYSAQSNYAAQPAYGPNWYSTYYSGCGCGIGSSY
jgi:hypothetical protein